MTKKSKRFQQNNSPQPVGQTRKTDEFDYETGEFVSSNSSAKRKSVNSGQLRESKRGKFVKANQSSGNSNFNMYYVLIPSLLIIIVGAILFMQNQSASNTGVAAANAIREVNIEPKVDGGKISVPVEEVRKNKLVAFDFKSGDKTVPLTAWVTPSGAIKTAIRICEPCNGYSFRIEGNELVCNVCGTRWNLESLKGISGGCQEYPPDPMPNVIDGDNVVMDQTPVLAWQRRP